MKKSHLFSEYRQYFCFQWIVSYIVVRSLENDNAWLTKQSCATRPASVIRLWFYSVITAIRGTLTKATCCGEHFSYENEHQQRYATNHKTVTKKRYRPLTNELCSTWLCAMQNKSITLKFQTNTGSFRLGHPRKCKRKREGEELENVLKWPIPLLSPPLF